MGRYQSSGFTTLGKDPLNEGRSDLVLGSGCSGLLLLIPDALLVVCCDETAGLDGRHAGNLVSNRLTGRKCPGRDQLRRSEFLRVSSDHPGITEVSLNPVERLRPPGPLALDHIKQPDGVDHRRVKVSRGGNLCSEVKLSVCPVDRICRRGVVVDNAQLIRGQVSRSCEVHGRRPQLIDVRLLGARHQLLNRSRGSILDRTALLISLIVDDHSLTDTRLEVEVIGLDVQRNHLWVGVELTVNLCTEISTSSPVHNSHHVPGNSALAPGLISRRTIEHGNKGNSASTVDRALNFPVTQVLLAAEGNVLVLVVHDVGQGVTLLVPLVNGEARPESTRDAQVPEPRRIQRAEAPRNHRRLTSALISSSEAKEVAPVDEHALEALVELTHEASLLKQIIHPPEVLGLLSKHIAFKLDSVGQGPNSLTTPAEDGDKVLVLRIDGDTQVLELLLRGVVSPPLDVSLLLIRDLLVHREEVPVLVIFESSDHW